MEVSYWPRIVDHGGAVEYMGGWDVSIDGSPRMTLDKALGYVRNLIQETVILEDGPIAYAVQHPDLCALKELERRLSNMTEHDNVKPEFTFADDGNGYRIDIKGTVWHESHSAWVSMVRPDGKRLYIRDMLPSDSIIVHGLVQRWEHWNNTGAVGSPSKPETPAGANGPAEPLPEFIAQQVDGLVTELTQSLPKTNCDGHVFCNAEQPWNELDGMIINEHGSVFFIGVTGQPSISSLSFALGKRTFAGCYKLTDRGKATHDELVRRWEARHLERMRTWKLRIAKLVPVVTEIMRGEREMRDLWRPEDSERCNVNVSRILEAIESCPSPPAAGDGVLHPEPTAVEI